MNEHPICDPDDSSKSKELRLQQASLQDAEEIRWLMIEVEADEKRRWYTGDERPFIPGFDSVHMQRYHARTGRYDKIMYQGTLAGVVLVSTTGREHARIDRLYLRPSCQGAGIGSLVLDLIERKYPQVTDWSLDSIRNSPRNLHFYEKNGYVRSGEDEAYVYYVKKRAVNSESLDRPDSRREALTENEHKTTISAATNPELVANRSFTKADFRDCDLTDTDFMGCNLSRSSYSRLHMAEASFSDCNLSKCKITNANLRGMTIGDSTLDEAEICHASLNGIYIHDVHVDETPPLLERCELPLTKMTDCNLSYSALQNVRLSEASLTNVSLKNAEVHGSDWRGMSVHSTDLSNASFAGCKYAGMSIEGIPVLELLALYRSTRNANPKEIDI
ncbi:GNAT family N-acetyltransferase [Saccharibacillus sacchari]|uniref:GNAT family N-acetyltransferase n=1 Tax=Saccharibacillus sacchari TaxID=456493 RepID=UPI0004B3E414|nr:GNAT family N-acetyltransferase [Saccharibacillus sacchari]